MRTRHLYQPFAFGRQGSLATCDDVDRQLADAIMAALFTRPGERVNQPEFGVGLERALFESLDPLSLSAIAYQVERGLQRSVGPMLELEDVALSFDDGPELRGQLLLRIVYRWRGSVRQPGDGRRRTLEVVA